MSLPVHPKMIEINRSNFGTIPLGPILRRGKQESVVLYRKRELLTSFFVMDLFVYLLSVYETCPRKTLYCISILLLGAMKFLRQHQNKLLYVLYYCIKLFMCMIQPARGKWYQLLWNVYRPKFSFSTNKLKKCMRMRQRVSVKIMSLHVLHPCCVFCYSCRRLCILIWINLVKITCFNCTGVILQIIV